MRNGLLVLGAVVVACCISATPAFGHAERPSYYPNFDPLRKVFDPAPEIGPSGSVPKYRSRGIALVVCKGDSLSRIRRLPRRTRAERAIRNRNITYLRHCRFRHIQHAVNAARNNTRILVLPGVYREEPSRAVPDPDPKCNGMYVNTPDSGGVGSGGFVNQNTEPTRAPSYEYHFNCPNSQNLIAIMGDSLSDPDRRCDRKCNIQISGTARPQDVLLSGERSKLNVIRADRADGVYLSNFTVEFSDFNNIYALETDGFHFNRIVSRYSREYGFLSFASDHGLYQNLEAHGSGDSGIYPGSGPEGHCRRYGIEIRNSDSHGNTIGYSGTAGNGVWAHDNKFHHNSAGMTTDSFASGHPGMPQDCAKWENNQIYSNNLDLFNSAQDAYCQQPVERRDPKRVCPTFPVPVGTGIVIGGGNDNIVRNNHIWDNWRQGTFQIWVPTELRGPDSTGQSSNNMSNQYDTSNGNRYENNKMGVRPDGTRDPNGVDSWWDEEGGRNCWQGNVGPGGGAIRTDPAIVPTCASGGSAQTPGNPIKQGMNVSCATWNPTDNTDPPGCAWFDRPSEPR